MITFALSGGCIINRRFSVCEDQRFRALVDVIRGADVAFSHLEGTIAEADGPEVYPAAEAGWTWIRTPSYFGEELKWAGFNIVSHASNHSLDYMYGGLYATWARLKQSGLPFAGTGMTLKEARRPAYLDTAKGRVALVSSSSTTPDWARAADPIRDDRGRPGANQIRLIQVLDREAAEALRATVRRAGWWMTEVGDDIMVSPPGLHNTVIRYRISDEASPSAIADPDDVAANLAAVRAAKERADFVIFHIHNHEWDPAGGLATPPAFVRDLAHRAVDAGADIFIAEGAHALLRGIEIYRGKPIFYDPGDLFKDGNSKTRPLSEYYWVQGTNSETGRREITTATSQVHRDLGKLPVPSHPVGGYNTGKVLAVIVPVCRFDDRGQLVEIRVHPAVHLKESHIVRGLPGLQTGEDARRIVHYLGELSEPFGTRIDFVDGVGLVKLPAGDLHAGA
jgi:poly-gamma-glutamate synthesis protein (capsule biosynthesis protein)